MKYERFVYAVCFLMTMFCGIAWALFMKPYLGVITFLLLGLSGFVGLFIDS
jgi:hypothetical protein